MLSILLYSFERAVGIVHGYSSLSRLRNDTRETGKNSKRTFLDLMKSESEIQVSPADGNIHDTPFLAK